MKKEFTQRYMRDNKGCYDLGHLNSLSFMKKEVISIDDIIHSEIPIKDKFWFVIKKTELTKEQKQQIAIDVAEIVLPTYEEKYPDSKAPREAIEAAKLYLAGHISINELIVKRKAAAAAAYDAYDVYYAAAAYAAVAAAYTAYDVYYAYAAAYDDYAENDTSYTGKLFEYLKNIPVGK